MDIKKIGEGIRSRVSAPVVMLVAALLIAAVASYWSYSFLKKKAAAGQPTGNYQAIVVSAVEMKLGTVITEEMVRTQPYLKESLPAGHFTAPEAVVGRVVLYPILVNEAVTEQKLAPDTVRTGGMAAVLTPGKRAMAVKVDKVIGISGFIRPGHRVDVIASISRSDRDGVTSTITKIVLENILVLAAGPEVDQAGDKGTKQQMVDVITLEVTPEEGEKLALATTEGKLQLALRSYADTQAVETRGTTLPRLLSNVEDKAPAAPRVRRAPPRPAVPTFSVEVIRGDKVSEEKFRREGQ